MSLNAELIYVVVQKRTHCRFFAKDQSGINNVPPGTVVDRDVTTLGHRNFYMVSWWRVERCCP